MPAHDIWPYMSSEFSFMLRQQLAFLVFMYNLKSSKSARKFDILFSFSQRYTVDPHCTVPY